MNIFNHKRIFILSLIISCLFVVLIVQLANLTIVQGNEYSERSANRTTKTITYTGLRGTIMDSSGVPLAYDERSFNVNFHKDPSRTSDDDRAYYTGIISRTIEIIEQNGGEVVDYLNIKRDEAGEYYLDFGTTDSDIHKKREDRWKADMYVTKYDDVEMMYNALRQRYQLPTEMPYEQARKVLSIWQELQLKGGSSYLPVVMAYGVNDNTVAILETLRNELEGVEIAEGTTRVYPKGTTAAHVIGYMGKIQDAETLNEMSQKGYTVDSKIGIAGIEKSFEEELSAYLTERAGTKEVEVNNIGQVVRVMNETEPSNGNNIMLSIDLELQMAVEKSLEENIATIRSEQQAIYNNKKEYYENKLVEAGRTSEIKFAQTGAAVVLDIKAGKARAIASYPSYDVNLFTDGVSDEELAYILDENLTPLFNNAVSSKGTPGSIFKLATAVAALMETETTEVTVDTIIDDEGYYTKILSEGAKVTANTPSCWVRPSFGKHANQDLKAAIRNSCNYYFYELANRTGISNLVKWASNLGLDSRTGIELPSEAKGQIGGQKILYNNESDANNQNTAIPILVKNLLKTQLAEFGEDRNIEYTDEELDNAANQLMALASDENTEMGPGIRSVLAKTLGISQTISNSKGWDNIIASTLTELIWNPTRTILTGIGQGVSAVTPVAVARYVAAILNGGTVYNVSIVEKILSSDGELIEEVEPSVFKQLDIPKEYLDAIKEGMAEVISPEDGGTAAKYFKNYKYLDEIGGKTGTAQVSTIDIENNSWFVGFCPKEDPEIVVVAYVPHGYSGGLSSLIAKDVFTYYLDEKERKAETDIPIIEGILN